MSRPLEKVQVRSRNEMALRRLASSECRSPRRCGHGEHFPSPRDISRLSPSSLSHRGSGRPTRRFNAPPSFRTHPKSSVSPSLWDITRAASLSMIPSPGVTPSSRTTPPWSMAPSRFPSRLPRTRRKTRCLTGAWRDSSVGPLSG